MGDSRIVLDERKDPLLKYPVSPVNLREVAATVLARLGDALRPSYLEDAHFEITVGSKTSYLCMIMLQPAATIKMSTLLDLADMKVPGASAGEAIYPVRGAELGDSSLLKKYADKFEQLQWQKHGILIVTIAASDASKSRRQMMEELAAKHTDVPLAIGECDVQLEEKGINPNAIEPSERAALTRIERGISLLTGEGRVPKVTTSFEENMFKMTFSRFAQRLSLYGLCIFSAACRMKAPEGWRAKTWDVCYPECVSLVLNEGKVCLYIEVTRPQSLTFAMQAEMPERSSILQEVPTIDYLGRSSGVGSKSSRDGILKRAREEQLSAEKPVLGLKAGVRKMMKASAGE